MQKPCLIGMVVGLSCLAHAQTNFPPPPAPAGNPVTTEKTLLGMALFWEEQLSSTGTVACGTCHDFGHGGVDARAGQRRHPGADNRPGTADDVSGSPGVVRTGLDYTMGSPTFGLRPQVTARRAPTVFNTGYHTHLFYDGRAERGDYRDPVTNQIVLTGPVALENLIKGPPVNEVEMGHVGRSWPQVASRIAASEPLVLASDLPPRLATFVGTHTYPELFALAFGTPDVTPSRIVMAIATYLRTLNTDQTRFDRYLNNTVQLTPDEAAGLQLFTSPAQGAVKCSTCHGDFEPRVRQEGPVAGAMTQTFAGPYGAPNPTRLVFHNVGVRPAFEDPGRSAISSVAAEFGKFRTASLRGVELTGPYFHNGSMATLRDVIDFYDRGGDFGQNQSPGLTPRAYTTYQKDALEALLGTLTDPRVVAGTVPFDHPTLGSQNGKLPQPIGPGSAVGNGRATATTPFAPLLGENSFSILLDGVSAGAFTLMMWDTALLPSGPDPGNFYFALGTSPNFLVVPIGPAQDLYGQGTSRLRMPLPANPAFRGLRLYAQWLVIEPSVAWNLATSNALGITLR
ncbi:MAG: hypothetical protein KDC48_19705 [Planctomycetes bacterium]|nr:hypothetical protein [Planctomycetota bacterium]